jgi:hypothetical protein
MRNSCASGSLRIFPDGKPGRCSSAKLIHTSSDKGQYEGPDRSRGRRGARLRVGSLPAGCVAAPLSAEPYRPAAPRRTRREMRLGPRAEKCASGDRAVEARSGWGYPRAGAQSVGQAGVPYVRGESAPPRTGAPAAHFCTDAVALAASRRQADRARPPRAASIGSEHARPARGGCPVWPAGDLGARRRAAPPERGRPRWLASGAGKRFSLRRVGESPPLAPGNGSK